MAQERQGRLDLRGTADRFVETWKGLRARHAEVGWSDPSERKASEGRIRAVAKGLRRDPQMQAV